MFLNSGRLLGLLLVLFAILLSGCNLFSSYSKYDFQQIKMGTLVGITVYEKKELPLQSIKKNIEEAFLLIDRYQKEFFDVNNEKSEIAQINMALAKAEPSVFNKGTDYLEFKVSDDLYRVFEISLAVSKETDFVFDISFKSVELLWANALKRSSLPSKAQIEHIKSYLGPDVIKLKNANRVLIKSNSKIALGGIAKGYIIEKVFSFLRTRGLNNFIINAGGDIKLSGSKGAKPWTTSVLAPDLLDAGASSYAYCTTKDQKLGIATSGSYYRFTEFEGKRFSHIIDTRTAMPSESDILSITVLYSDLSYTDAYATAFYIQGYKKLTEQFNELDRKNIGVIVVNQHHQKAMNKTAARYCLFYQDAINQVKRAIRSQR